MFPMKKLARKELSRVSFKYFKGILLNVISSDDG